jgi:hypothetical protein
MAGLIILKALYNIKHHAKIDEQSSAPYILAPINAILIPINAATEVMTSLTV